MTDRIVFVFTLILAALYFYATAQIQTYDFGDPLGPKTFPRLLGVGLLISAALLAMEMWRARKTPAPREESATEADRSHVWVVAAVVAWTAVYFVAFTRAGYVLSTIVYLQVLTTYFNRGKWLANVLTSVLFSAVTYLMFTKLLGVSLPRGVLPF